MMSWNEKIQDFKNYLKFEKNFAENTLQSYVRDICKLQEFAESHLELSPQEITLEHLQEFLYQLTKEQFSERSQARWISSTKSFFKFLVDDEIRQDNPAELLESPKLGIYLPDTLSKKEIDNISQAIDWTSDIGRRNHCIVEVLYGCGLRVSELVNLRISDINFKEFYTRIYGKGSKVRFVPLAKYTAKVIQEYIAEVRCKAKISKKSEDILFINNRGGAMSRTMIFLIIKELAQKANISKNISPHTFRHSFATHLLQNGVDLRYIQEMLGHSSITTTEIYTHLETEDLRKTILNHHPRKNEL